ncbi:hypothetical protein GUI37_00985 [Helcococcus kunzii]|uniref:PIN/TRAM domain-containing protein n=1 Tax=Helcococcus kunzii TaxID=40091 RepID=UPI001BAFA454|nr:PIN domain-containing protein [Helcococcus kunzii]QUY64161.1 hypothetical protein GUI37_00985 [Helcococcus kunzii]
MIKRVINIIVALLGGTLGYALAEFIVRSKMFAIKSTFLLYSIYGVMVLLGAGLFYLMTPFISDKVKRLIDNIDDYVVKQPKDSLVVGALGIIFGIIIALLLSVPITMLNLPSILEPLKSIVTVLLYVVFVSLGYRLSMKYKDDIFNFFNRKKATTESEYVKTEASNLQNKREEGEVSAKLLDTSVLIDGRIQQIAETGFIEGDVIVPNFVLEELQIIADSADALKRERGRRGLDIVNSLRNSKKIKFRNSRRDYDDTTEVDIKLLKFATETGATIVTNDFNLNKLAVVQGIKVLNINDLANSVKTVVIPGEKMIVNIVKEGKEKDQGLAYLDDGTMIVIEEGKHLIGEKVQVVVSTVLQTAAGKMIFTKLVD